MIANTLLKLAVENQGVVLRAYHPNNDIGKLVDLIAKAICEERGIEFKPEAADRSSLSCSPMTPNE